MFLLKVFCRIPIVMRKFFKQQFRCGFKDGYMIVNERKMPEVIVFLILLLTCASLCQCTNWQGAEFRIGIGQYNGANETKTYTKEVEKK